MTRSTALALVASFAAVAMAPRPARAAGFALDTQSARTVGMAGAATGMIDDASAIYFNPAGIAQGRFFDAVVAGELIFPSSTFTDQAGKSTTTPFRVVPPVEAYFSGGVTKDFSIGVGVFTPYGLTIGWPDAWEGRSLLTYAQLATYYINPTVAYRFGPLRIGGGVQVVPATVDLERDIALPGGVYGTSQLGATSIGIGGNVGIQIEAVPRILSFGAHYRSAVAIDFDGDAHFGNIPQILAGTLHDQPASTRIVMPDSFAFGVAVRPIPKLVVDLDVVYTGWNHFQSVDIAFPEDASGTLATSEPKRWRSTVNVHLGAELGLGDAWRVRAGAMLDPTPSPDDTVTPDLPDSTRLAFSLGGGYLHKKSGLRFDVAYELVLLLSRTSTAPQLPGDYSGYANIVSVGVGWSSPRPKGE
jgi:long-chain fatty acid transport protein